MRRGAIYTIIRVMEIYDEYIKTNNGFTDGIGKYASEKLGMTISHIYAMRYYGQMLVKYDVYEQAISENWGLVKIREYVKESRIKELKRSIEKEVD